MTTDQLPCPIGEPHAHPGGHAWAWPWLLIAIPYGLAVAVLAAGPLAALIGRAL